MLLILANQLQEQFNTQKFKMLKKKIIVMIYFTTFGFNQFSGIIFVDRLTQANLATKSGIADFITKSYFDDKLKKQQKSDSK